MMKKHIRADFFSEYINISDMEPNGRNLFIYTRTEASIEEDKYLSNLWLYNLNDDETRQLTSEGTVPFYRWLDDENIILTAPFDEKDKKEAERGIPYTVFGKLNVITGKYQRLYSIFHDISDFRIIDEKRLLILAADSPVRDAWLLEADGDWDKYLKIKEREDRMIVVDEFPYYADGSGFINKERGRLYFFNDGEMTLLTEDDITVKGIDSYKDKYGVFYAMEAGGYQRSQGMLFVVDYDELNVRPLDSSMKYIYTKVQAIDEEKILALRNDYVLHGEYQDEYIDVININTERHVRNNKLTDWHLYDMVLTDMVGNAGWLSKYYFGKEGFYFISTVSGSSDIFYAEYGDDDSLRRVTKEDGKIIDYIVLNQDTHDEKIFMMAMRGMGGTEFYELNPHTGEEKTKSSLNSDLTEKYNYPETEEISFVNSDGVYIEGWAMRPADFEPGKKYPAVLFIHGGPECAWGPVLQNERMYLASNGIGAIFCNPRGSEGRGADFCDIRGRWMDVDYKDLMEFTDYAVEVCDWIDEDRLGITGGSYGGIMTNMIIGRTNRFSAAMSDRGVADQISDFFLCDLGLACGFDSFQCTPWDNPGYLWEQSALKYAPNVKTPVLFIHGEVDYRCPMVNALEFHTAITYHGGTSKVIAFKGESHGLSGSGHPYNKMRRLEEILKWFNQYLKEE